MVYMDNTIWLAKSKEQIELTLALVNSFIEMTGTLQKLKFDSQFIEVSQQQQPIRYLRV